MSDKEEPGKKPIKVSPEQAAADEIINPVDEVAEEIVFNDPIPVDEVIKLQKEVEKRKTKETIADMQIKVNFERQKRTAASQNLPDPKDVKSKIIVDAEFSPDEPDEEKKED